METDEVLLLIALLIIIGSFVFFVIKLSIEKKRRKAITNILSESFSSNIIHKSGVNFFEYYIDTDNIRYLIKVLPFDVNHELIITNKYFWCDNADLRGWRRSTVPDLFPRVKEFIDFDPQIKQKIIKIALIYPDCYSIIRYLNESDVAIVNPTDLVYGVYFVRSQNLKQFFTSLDQKNFTKYD